MDEPRFPDQEPPPIEARLAPPETNRPPYPPAGGPVESPRPKSGMFQSKGTVLAILFLVTGALGIPLLWENKSFTSQERLTWSVVVSIYTFALIALATAVCYWSYKQIFP